MKITFLGHAAFALEVEGISLLIDPFLQGNPLCAPGTENLRPDYILVTHGHADHMGDAFAIASRSSSTVVAIAEIASLGAKQGVKTHGMNIGGSFNFGPVRITMTPALHSSSRDGVYLGEPCGFIIAGEGKKVYHAGDTALFSDMSLIGRKGLDLALLPIGDNYTMGPEDAVEAVKLLQPKAVIPMHYNTWDVIKADAAGFKEKVEKETGVAVHLLAPGQSLTL